MTAKVDRGAAIETLRELILASEAYRAVVAARLGISVSDSQAVSYLLTRGPLGQNELAAALGFTTGSITVLVDRLERSNYAERIDHATDRRRSIVQISASGRARLADVGDWLFGAFESVPVRDLPILTEGLRAVAVGLRARAAQLSAEIPRSRPN